MMFRRIAVAALATSSSAFNVGTKGIPGARHLVTASRATGPSFTSRSVIPASIQKSGGTSVGRRGRTGLSMVFGNLFGGGAFETKVDYNALDHPGPELAQWAKEGKVPKSSEKDPNLKLASFAGGCFWGIELAYQRVPGVHYTAVGYSQGNEEEPNYDQVCAGVTDHTESVIVYYDPKEVSYDKLLDTFFDQVDPTTFNGQGGDIGKQYRTGVYYHTHEQEKAAKARFEAEKENYRRPIASELKEAKPFWPAEKYHQQYLEKGGRFGQPQNAEKGATEPIRCYG